MAKLCCVRLLCVLEMQDGTRKKASRRCSAEGDNVQRIPQQDPSFLGNNADLSRRILDGKPQQPAGLFGTRKIFEHMHVFKNI